MSSVIMQYGLIRKIANIIRPGTNQTSTPISVALKLYRNIHDLPLTIFIDCLCDQKYSGLVIAGEATENELQEIWQDLFEQYTELIGGQAVINKLNDLKRLNKLEAKLIVIEQMIDCMQYEPSQELFEMLYSFGYPLPKMQYSASNFDKVVKVFIGYFRRDKTQYKLTVAAKAEAPTESAQAAKRNDFTKILNRVAIAFKLPAISVNSITVAQYCNYVLEYRDYCDQVKKQNEK